MEYHALAMPAVALRGRHQDVNTGKDHSRERTGGAQASGEGLRVNRIAGMARWPPPMWCTTAVSTPSGSVVPPAPNALSGTGSARLARTPWSGKRTRSALGRTPRPRGQGLPPRPGRPAMKGQHQNQGVGIWESRRARAAGRARAIVPAAEPAAATLTRGRALPRGEAGRWGTSRSHPDDRLCS